MSDRDFFWMFVLVFSVIAAVWLYWPRDVPCERLQSIGGEMVGTPPGCYVDLRQGRP